MLIAQNLAKSYEGRPVVSDVSLMVKRCEVVGLLGRNGAGKTTIFSMITGLLSTDKGCIRLDDVDVTRLPLFQRARRGIGYLPQQRSIFGGLTVEQNILLVLEMHEGNSAKRRDQLDGLMRDFGLYPLRTAIASKLSGGERRRCEIARALASRPSFILLDEPFSGVDPIAIHDIRSMISYLKNRGVGVLITDHNVRETLSLVDRAYIIDSGRILVHGTTEAIIKDESVRATYLGPNFHL